MVTASDLEIQSVDMTVTLDAELSPRKIDLVGIGDLPEVFAEGGKVNQKTGKPLSIFRISILTKDDPTFPKPWVEKSGRRFWRRTDVERWLPTWGQQGGPRPARTNLVLEIIESQPDRIWSSGDLLAEVRKSNGFTEPRKPLKAMGKILTRSVQAGRIRRVEPGRYQATKNGV